MSPRIPDRPSEMESEGIPDPGSGGQHGDITGQDEGAMEPPHDAAIGVADFGTTPAEVHDGESLSGRLDREVPDVLEAADRPADESPGADTPFDERAGQGIGRLVEPDEGAHSDVDSDLIATDVGTDLGGYSAEESAMHLEPEV